MYYQVQGTQRKAEAVHNAEMAVEERFAQGLGFHKIVWLFTIGSVLGYVIETVFCLVFKGYLESRKGMIYGPFNQIYGFGAVLLAVLLLKVKEKGGLALFVCGALIGGVFEFVCSYVQEAVFGTVSWDYKWMSVLSIGGRTNLLYMAFFGGLAVVFIEVIYPAISSMIEMIRAKEGRVLSWLMVVFMAGNLALSATAVVRWTERVEGIPAQSQIDEFIDDNYPNETLQQIYPSMMFMEQNAA